MTDFKPIKIQVLVVGEKGSAASGNFGHRGRPGHLGGSVAKGGSGGGGAGAAPEKVDRRKFNTSKEPPSKARQDEYFAIADKHGATSPEAEKAWRALPLSDRKAVNATTMEKFNAGTLKITPPPASAPIITGSYVQGFMPKGSSMDDAKAVMKTLRSNKNPSKEDIKAAVDKYQANKKS